MAETPEIVITVIDQKGHCSQGHKVGDTWRVGGTTPPGVCLSAWNALYSDLRVLQMGGSLPWEKDPDRATVTCPDSANPVVFGIRRVKR